MQKGKSYGYDKIENFANKNNFSIENIGINLIGESFIILKHRDKDIVISFVLSCGSNAYIYDCVYSDLYLSRS